jgi:hypothetical protein
MASLMMSRENSSSQYDFGVGKKAKNQVETATL